MYNALGIEGHRAVLVAGIYNCVGPIANLIFIFFILDRVGRKKPLLFGALCITLALFAEAGLNAANPDGSRLGYSIGGVFFLFLVSVIFSLSFGPISWVYMSEIMPMQIRGRGCAFATGIGNWLVSTLFAQISPIALGKIGWVSRLDSPCKDMTANLAPEILLRLRIFQHRHHNSYHLVLLRRNQQEVSRRNRSAIR